MLTLISILINIQSINSEYNEIIQEFIRSANNKTISIVSIDNAESNFQFILQQYPRVILKFSHAGWLENCNSYANKDLHNHTILIDLLALMEHNDFIIFTSRKSLESALHCFVHPLSRFLLIVTNNDSNSTLSSLSPSIIMHLLNTTWMSNGALKVFISASNYNKNNNNNNENYTVYMFNPFHRNEDGSFGKLNSFVNFTFNVGEGELKRLNGYPIRVELFSSTYAIPLRKPAATLEDFYGPEVDVAKLVGKFWNSSGKLIHH